MIWVAECRTCHAAFQLSSIALDVWLSLNVATGQLDICRMMMMMMMERMHLAEMVRQQSGEEDEATSSPGV